MKIVLPKIIFILICLQSKLLAQESTNCKVLAAFFAEDILYKEKVKIFYNTSKTIHVIDTLGLFKDSECTKLIIKRKRFEIIHKNENHFHPGKACLNGDKYKNYIMILCINRDKDSYIIRYYYPRSESMGFFEYKINENGVPTRQNYETGRL